MEIIKNINKFKEWGVTDDEVEGYEVITTKQRIKLSITNEQLCCEDWGYFWCNDRPEDFIGAKVIGVSLNDKALREVRMTEMLGGPAAIYEGGVMFVDIQTDRGVLQFVAYNMHNGYYGHDARVECTQLQHEKTL